MTYTVDIVNICINHLIELTPIKHISKMLSISEPTIRKWHNLYNNFIENKIFLTDNDYNKKDKKHGASPAFKISKILKDFRYFKSVQQ